MDFLTGMGIFSIVLILFVITVNTMETLEPTHVTLLDSAVDLSNIIMTTGSPSDWDASTIQILGLTNGNYRINISKWDLAENFTQEDIASSTRVKGDFGLFISDDNDCLLDGVIGDLTVNATCPYQISVDSDTLVSVRRLVIYDSKPAVLHIYAWS